MKLKGSQTEKNLLIAFAGAADALMDDTPGRISTWSPGLDSSSFS